MTSPLSLPAPDPKRDARRATDDLRENREGLRRKAEGTVFVPDAAPGADPIPWE